MKTEIYQMAAKLNFGVDDLLSVDAVMVKKYLIIYRLSKTYSIDEITKAFNYSNRQSVYSAIRKVRDWVQVDEKVKALWLLLQ